MLSVRHVQSKAPEAGVRGGCSEPVILPAAACRERIFAQWHSATMRKELDLASELAVRAGLLLLEHYGPAPSVEWKSNGDPVTEADRLASEFLTREIRSHFPAESRASGSSIQWTGRGSSSNIGGNSLL